MATRCSARVSGLILFWATLGLGLAVHADTATESYVDPNGRVITATITAPDLAEPDTDFTVDVAGSLDGFAYFFELWEDAVWSWTPGDFVDVTAGTQLDGDLGFGGTHSASYVFNKPEGEYSYLYIFRAAFAHSAFEVPVEVTVTVASEPSLCGVGWLPPLQETRKAGSTLPLKFTGFESADEGCGAFVRDEGVTVTITDADGNVVEAAGYTGNPSTGVDISDSAEKYHFNWQTAKDMAGEYTITVQFSTGDVLTRTITLT